MVLSQMVTNGETEIEFRDLSELGELCGCTDLQRKFAEGLLAGLSQTEAAFRAGYSGARDSAQLRSAASQAAQTKPVQALLALAESRGLGTPNAPGDREELLRILWSHARSKDKQSSIRASIELDRIGRDERSGSSTASYGDVICQFLNFRNGVGIAALMFQNSCETFGPRIDVNGLPHFKALAPAIAKGYPETWGRIRAALDSDCQADVDKMAAAPETPIEKLAKPWNWDGQERETLATDGASDVAG
jgi:hypothetical protein